MFIICITLIVLCSCGVWAGEGKHESEDSSGMLVVDIGGRSPAPPLPVQLAVQVCSGLTNRAHGVGALNGTAYVLMSSVDEYLLNTVVDVPTPPLTSVPTFLEGCLHGKSAVARGIVRYNFTEQKELVPLIITIAGVLGGVPLELGNPIARNATVVFDALTEFSGMSGVNATARVYELFGNQTTTMAMMDPGFDGSSDPFDPHITGEPNLSLADFVVSKRLFNFFLYFACIPSTAEHALMEKMVGDSSNGWPRPIATFGYNDAFPILGDLFEAETTCVSQHNMGEIATDTVPNLAFFATRPPITTPIHQVPDPSPPTSYNASKTYLTLIVGDGDNIGMLRTSRMDWMSQRVKECAKGTTPDASMCYPLVWTLSPHIANLASDLVKWFFKQSYKTGADFFVLPPSGDLYAYPGLMNGTTQENFVTNTNKDAWLYNTSGTVDWEPFLSWDDALATYFPRYTETVGGVRGFFGVNVPFDLPVLPFLFTNETFKVIEPADSKGQPVVVFKPREWRGVGNTSIPFAQPEYLSPKDMAKEINGYEPGTVAYIYLTSDGGATLAEFDQLVPLLQEHVQVVNQNTIVDMALASHNMRTSTN